MANKQIMLDSGAFSVWSRQIEIDLDSYIRFCKRHPLVTYYVNLDVIPGSPNNVNSRTPEARRSACKQGWNNYQQMIRQIPSDKVIPVFHQGDEPEFLARYLNVGCTYIGISPANDRTTDEKIQWLRYVQKLIGDKEGNPIVRTHGFGVTSFRLMKFWRWHSVDSASWRRVAAYGAIWVPRKHTHGHYDYTRPYLLVYVSARQTQTRGPVHCKPLFHHIPAVKSTTPDDRYVQEYCERILHIPMGCSTTFTASSRSYKLKPNEEWIYRDRLHVIRIEEEGLSNVYDLREKANILYLNAVERALHKEGRLSHIFFAGGVHTPRVRLINNRLFSFYDIGIKKESSQVVEFERYEKEIQQS